jgi:hypothetical protein
MMHGCAPSAVAEPNDIERVAGGAMSVGDVIARAHKLLDDPDVELSLVDRVSFAITVATGGQASVPVTFAEIAEIAGVELDDVVLAVTALVERHGLDAGEAGLPPVE